MNVLITGGAGFVGSMLAKHLINNGFNVTLVDNMQDGHLDNIITESGRSICNVVFRDVRNNIDDLLKGTDIVVHLAGTSSLPKCQAYPQEAFSNNVLATINILEAIRRSNVKRFIFASTSAVYENNTNLPFSESDSVQPDLIYSTTKQMSEQICKSYANNYGLDIIIARFFNVYGEHQDIQRTNPPFVSYLAKQVRLQQRPVLYNKTKAKRDYIYIQDLLGYIMQMLASPKSYFGDVFNLCSGIGYSVTELVKIYGEISGTTIDPIYDQPEMFWDKFPEIFEGKSFNRDRVVNEVSKSSIGDNTRATQEFGYSPLYSVEMGLNRVYKYACNNIKL